jgi:Fe-S cluster assembly protein SufD
MGHGKYIDPIPSLPAATGNLKRLGAGEKLDLEYVILPGESKDIDVVIDLAGEGAEVTVKVLYLCGSSERVSIRTLVHHRVKNCKSNQIINGIAGGGANVTFDGRIIVAPGADGTEAYQENHNIVLTDEAKVETKPQLEIYADDVKCSHGATTGRLGEDELFYMRSRGIPEKEAKTLQMLSFLSPVIPEGRREEIEAAVRTL